MMNQPDPSAVSVGRFKCTFPGCHKVFNRSEHRNRHAKTHDPNLKHVCPICQKAYARSDVLKRHVQNHPQPTKPRDGATESAAPRNGGSGDLFGTRQSASPETTSQNPGLAEKLKERISRDPAGVQRDVDVYALYIHPFWPILNLSNFNIETAPPVLLAAMVMLAKWSIGDGDHQDYVPVFGVILALEMDDGATPLPILQARLLCLVYTLCNVNTSFPPARLLHWHASLITACRAQGYFTGEAATALSFNLNPSEAHILHDQISALSIFLLQADTYITLLLDTPPLLRPTELDIPLPSFHTTPASTPPFPPSASSRPLFNPLIQESIFERLLQHPHPQELVRPIGTHASLLSLTSGLWDATRQRRYRERVRASTPTATPPQYSDGPWSVRLDGWRVLGQRGDDMRHLSRYFQPGFTVAAIEPTNWVAFDLLVWHFGALALQAPGEVLRGIGAGAWDYPGDGGGNEVGGGRWMKGETLRLHLKGWVVTTAVRKALWNAAQILRVVAHESSGSGGGPAALESQQRRQQRNAVMLKPLLSLGLLVGATVLCVFARYRGMCPMCNGEGIAMDVIHDLTAIDDEDEKLARWLARGDVLVGLGWEQPICRCQFHNMADRFRGAIAARDGEDKARDFQRFLQGL